MVSPSQAPFPGGTPDKGRRQALGGAPVRDDVDTGQRARMLLFLRLIVGVSVLRGDLREVALPLP